jgi:NADPH:quinone reductase-like Zn-dependent oxidoreductase
MKAAVYRQYGPPEVVHIEDVPKPEIKDNEVLIRVRATTVSTGDWRLRSLDLPPGFGAFGRLAIGLTGPRKPILGSELAGVVEAVGSAVTRFKVGDEVFAFPGSKMGAHAEYRAMPEDGNIALKPANLSFGEAAALCFGGSTALDFFRRGKLASGESVLVNGASGTVGSACVQIAKHLGARVTGVTSAANADLVRSIGADRVIDYRTQDFTTTGEKYDVIVDTIGNAPYARSRAALKEDGRLLAVLNSFGELVSAPWINMRGRQRVVVGPAAERVEDMAMLAELAGAGRFKPLIDVTLLFDQIVEAHRRVESGRKRGSVVVSMPA